MRMSLVWQLYPGSVDIELGPCGGITVENFRSIWKTYEIVNFAIFLYDPVGALQGAG